MHWMLVSFTRKKQWLNDNYRQARTINDGSLVGQVDVCDVGDEIPHEAIGRMGVGFFRPIEEPLMVEREGLCSTQVEPSPSQDQLVAQEPSHVCQEMVKLKLTNLHRLKMIMVFLRMITELLSTSSHQCYLGNKYLIHAYFSSIQPCRLHLGMKLFILKICDTCCLSQSIPTISFPLVIFVVSLLWLCLKFSIYNKIKLSLLAMLSSKDLIGVLYDFVLDIMLFFF
jgi:hypothetical protein